MSNTVNIESAIKCLKSIVDNVLCRICDKLRGGRLRFGCGHAACEDCVASSGSCLLCLTPPADVHVASALDKPLTKQIYNVSNLLDTFQTLFHVNVDRHHRLSEQLKIEKELFPECIQAASKYTNQKRTSLTLLTKESRRPVYPGEFIKEVVEMDNFNYIEQWLDKQDQIPKPRKPFATLNINDPRQNQGVQNNIKSRADLILQKVTDNVVNSKKLQTTKTHFKTTIKKMPTAKQNRLTFKKLPQTENIIKKRNETVESGIEIDIDTVVIEDSQSEVIDKDKQAWLAVLEADKNKNGTIFTSKLDCTDLQITNVSLNNKIQAKVPFLKRSYLHGFSPSYSQSIIESKTSEAFKPVSISIENETFRTTITISNCSTHNIPGSKSVSIQTDNDILYATHSNNNKDNLMPTESQDIFTTSKQFPKEFVDVEAVDVQKEVVVLNSDSDSGDGMTGSLVEVTAVVHRSCEDVDYGVLTEMEQSTRRCRKRPRGYSPTSTNSSDKENYDPNRMKKTYGKKKRK